MAHSLNIPTLHIGAGTKSEIAKTVLMPGDPLRAKFIAENFLNNAVLFTSIRNIFGYTGSYKGKQVSVMASGMGMPSIGIYSFELFSAYDVDNIIRIGSCGAYAENIKLFDLILCEEAFSDSSFAKVQSGIDDDVIKSSPILNQKIIDTARKINIPIVNGRIHSSDVFYSKNFDDYKKIRDHKHCVAVEMEAFALFANAQFLNKQATTLVTVTDHLHTGEALTSTQRQNALIHMITLALESA